MNLAICCLSAPSRLADKDHQLGVKDGVDDPVITDSYPVEVLFKMDAPLWTGRIAKRAHSIDYALSIGRGYTLELSFDVPVEPEGIGHV